ncbi:DNA polymerase III alpha [Streptomyces phage BillNye]|uniref:DNA polymerase III alpha n=2 Tax=Wilnyevirus billnye TaxID=2560486 RepID=A0A2L1IVU7_9CAUD|nr:DNA polymerase exonuclease subunit [Streptomyces phage BillNye]AVD99274.1 DNA polymerase III alpha [Streptomyces phage BillNye]QBZ72357.1 DnaQ-like DNA polymerase III subunit [Streptomyces phage Circinus]
MTVRNFVFIDCETTGLNPKEDKLVELTYATNDSHFRTLYFGVTEVPPFIDELTKFTERGVADEPHASLAQINDFLETLDDQTMVSANPAFDKAFLEENGLWNGHYRVLDIEAYAMAKLGLDFVPSMKNIYDMLTERGYKLTTPDHSSYKDTKALREAFNILRYM